MAEKRISFRGLSPARSEFPIHLLAEAPTIFLLSPANLSGARAKLLFRESSGSELAQRLRSSQVSLGEIFSFVSGLYFRGKLAYASRFANPPEGIPGIKIITSSSGLLHPDHLIGLDWLRTTSDSLVHPYNPEYRAPLVRDAQALNQSLAPDVRIILLGSIATPKYVEPLLEIFGSRLYFPVEFVGRGDMSRGSLLLRCARQKMQLTYSPIVTTIRTTRRCKK